MSDLAAPARFSGDRAVYGDKVAVEFYVRSVQNPVKTREEGRPIHEPQDYVRFQQRGSIDETHLPIDSFLRNFQDAQDGEAYRERYDRWKANQREALTTEGTPLAVVFIDEPHIIDTARGIKVTTVEQMAALSEEGMRKLGMGARSYVVRAQRFIEASQRGMPAHEVETRLADLAARNAELEQKLSIAMANMDGRTREARALKAHGEA